MRLFAFTNPHELNTNCTFSEQTICVCEWTSINEQIRFETFKKLIRHMVTSVTKETIYTSKYLNLQQRENELFTGNCYFCTGFKMGILA